MLLAAFSSWARCFSPSTNSQSPSPPSSSIAYSLLSASSEQDNPSTSGCRFVGLRARGQGWGAWATIWGSWLYPLPPCGPCSSEQSARARTQKELMTALRELKLRLPPERRGKGRSGTLATLQYALACVKQVQGEWCFRGRPGRSWAAAVGQAPPQTPHRLHPAANQEYYQQWSLEEGEPCAMDMSTYTLEELEHITSEYTLRNQVSRSPASWSRGSPAPRAHGARFDFCPRFPA